MLFRLFHFWRGYVTLSVEGVFCERFLNLCIKKQIYLWQIKRLKHGRLQVNISLTGFRMLRPLLRICHCRVHILSKHGLPFVLHRYRKRYLFGIGMILFFGLIWTLSSFVWVIDVTGLETVSESEFRQTLTDCGLYIGARKRTIDPQALQDACLLARDDIVWMWADIRGTKAYVEAKERIPVPEAPDLDTPTNIVAAKDGVIAGMTVKQGQPVVSEGDTVAKGDLLVSGIMESEVIAPRLVSADGEVMARTWYEASKTVTTKAEVRTETGNVKKRYSAKIINFSINFFRNSGNIDTNYDKITVSKDLRLFRDWYLPIRITKEEFREVAVSTRNRTEQEAVTETAAELEQELLKTVGGAEILQKNVTHTKNEQNELVVTLTIEAKEPIGIRVPIGKEDSIGNQTSEPG